MTQDDSRTGWVLSRAGKRERWRNGVGCACFLLYSSLSPACYYVGSYDCQTGFHAYDWNAVPVDVSTNCNKKDVARDDDRQEY